MDCREHIRRLRDIGEPGTLLDEQTNESAATMEAMLEVVELAYKVPMSRILDTCTCDDCTAVRAMHKALAKLDKDGK